MIRRHPILFLLLFLLIGGITFAIIWARRPKPTLIRQAKVERMETLTLMVNASGEIRAHEMVDIQTEIAGVITELPVKEGQTVRKGDILLRIDPFQSEMELASQKGHYAAAQAEVRRMAATIATARSNMVRQREQIKSNQAELAQAQITQERDLSSLKRYQQLLEVQAISADEFETFESKSRISVQRVEGARAAIEQARAQLQSNELTVKEQQVMRESALQNLKVMEAALKRAEDQLSKTTIRAPMDGVIVRLNVDIGERAVPGIQSNPQATLMTMANLKTIEAELKVDETDITRVVLGQQAKITVDALPDAEIKGKVTEIGAAPINGDLGGNSGSQEEGKDFKVVITVDSPPQALRMGMLCDAEITINTRKNVLAIPIQALTTREVPVDDKGAYLPPAKPAKPNGAGQNVANAAPSPNGKKTKKKELHGVFIKDPQGFARFRVIKTGILGEMNVEVLEGLKEGEEVITGPLQSLRVLDEWTLVKLDLGKEVK